MRSIASKSSKLPRFGPRLRLVLLIMGVCGTALIGSLLGRGFAAPARPDGTPIVAATAPIVAPAALPTVAAAIVAEVQPPQATSITAPAAPPPTPASSTPAPAAPDPWPLLVEERFDAVSARWPEHTTPTWSTAYHDGRYLLQVAGRPSISYSAPLDRHDFRLRADVQIERGRAGLFFLIGRPNDFYRFLIDAEGRYQLEWQQVGASQPLIAWTESAALLRGAQAVNQLEVQRIGDELTLYANGTLLATYTLPAGNTLESRIGLALDAPAGQDDGRALFDNLFVHGPNR